MDTLNICKIGLFDRLMLDGHIIPLYYTDGIDITHGESIIDTVNMLGNYKYSICKIHLNILGCDNKLEDDIIEYRDNELKLNKIKYGDKTKYLIGYVDIIVIKGKYIDSDNLGIIKSLGNSESDKELLSKAISKLDSVHNIAILDKLYIHKVFRRNHIATWVQQNIFDMIKQFANIEVKGIMLIPGDFKREAEKMFNMSTIEYTNMLKKYYISNGYKNISKTILYKKNKNYSIT